MSRRTRLNKRKQCELLLSPWLLLKNSYWVHGENHLDATTTTRNCPSNVCDLGKLQTLVTNETIVKSQNAQI